MKQEVSSYDFYQAFQDIRPDNFSRAGLSALYDHLAELEADCGEEITLDVIALCRDYAEYNTATEAFEREKPEINIGEIIDAIADDNIRCDGLTGGYYWYSATDGSGGAFYTHATGNPELICIPVLPESDDDDDDYDYTREFIAERVRQHHEDRAEFFAELTQEEREEQATEFLREYTAVIEFNGGIIIQRF